MVTVTYIHGIGCVAGRDTDYGQYSHIGVTVGTRIIWLAWHKEDMRYVAITNWRW